MKLRTAEHIMRLVRLTEEADSMSTTLESENELLLQFIYACPIGLIEFAADGAIKMINPLAMQLLIPLVRTPVVENFFDIIGDFAPELRNLVDDFVPPQGTVSACQRIMIRPGSNEDREDGKVLACTLVKLDSNHLIATLSDISQQVVQERRLKQAESWFASMLDSVENFAVLSIDAAGCINAVNSSVLRQTGFHESETIGRRLDMFDVPSLDVGNLSLHDQVAVARRDGWYLNEGWRKRSSGKPYWCQTLIAARCKDQGDDELLIAGYTVVLREVTRQMHETGNLKQLLTRDHLTGACNRSYFFELAERECSRSRRYGTALALIAIDIDHFKRVNDTYGHAAGDQVLKLFSQVCMALLRPSDTFARLGGEEFVVLLPSTDLDGAKELAERLRATIATAAAEIAGRVVRVTASLGCADMKGGAVSLAALLGAADRALYLAKQNGRDRVMLSGPVLIAATAQ